MHLGLFGGGLWINLNNSQADAALAALRVSERSVSTIRDIFLRYDCMQPGILIKVQFDDGYAMITRDPSLKSDYTLRVDLFDRSLFY